MPLTDMTLNASTFGYFKYVNSPAFWNLYPRASKMALKDSLAFIEIHTHNQMIILRRRFRTCVGYAELALHLKHDLKAQNIFSILW
jgi:hypothetical protein